jgi:hypothetical protein
MVASVNYIELGGMQWRVELSRLDDGDYAAVIPALGSKLFRGIGSTQSEALEILHDVAPLTYAWVLKNGDDVPEPTWEELSQEFKQDVEPDSFGLHGILGSIRNASTGIQPSARANSYIERRPPQRVLHNVSTELFAATC